MGTTTAVVSRTDLDRFLDQVVYFVHLLLDTSFLHRLCRGVAHWHGLHQVCCSVEGVVYILQIGGHGDIMSHHCRACRLILETLQ